VDLISGALSAGMVGPFQLQAAIAAVHAEAPSPRDLLEQLVERGDLAPVGLGGCSR
jgi:predicted RNA polymerase sigma factor